METFSVELTKIFSELNINLLKFLQPFSMVLYYIIMDIFHSLRKGLGGSYVRDHHSSDR